MPTREHVGQLRGFGAFWVLISPIVLMMGVASPPDSMVWAYILLVAFATVSLVGLVSGLGALFRQRWAAAGLLAVASVSAFGLIAMSAIVALMILLGYGGAKGGSVVVLLIVLPNGLFGYGFFQMARSLRQIRREWSAGV